MGEGKTVGDVGVRVVEAMEKAGTGIAGRLDKAAEGLAQALATAMKRAGVPAEHAYRALVRRRHALGRARMWYAISGFVVAGVAAVVGITTFATILVTKPCLSGDGISSVGVLGCILIAITILATPIATGVGVSCLADCWADLTEPEGRVIRDLMDEVRQLLR